MSPERNERRCCLIYKKHFGGGLTRDETGELRSLQDEMEAEITSEAERMSQWVKTLIGGNGGGDAQ